MPHQQTRGPAADDPNLRPSVLLHLRMPSSCLAGADRGDRVAHPITGSIVDHNHLVEKIVRGLVYHALPEIDSNVACAGSLSPAVGEVTAGGRHFSGLNRWSEAETFNIVALPVARVPAKPTQSSSGRICAQGKCIGAGRPAPLA